jgi:hypothetical protein
MIRTLPLLLLLSALLAACGTTPPSPPAKEGAAAARPAPPPSDDEATRIERQAQRASGRSAALFFLRAAELRVQRGQWSQAAANVDRIDPDQLLTDDWLRLQLLQVELALDRGEARDAYRLLRQERLQFALFDVDQETRLRVARLRARTLEGIGSFLAAARERMLLHSALDAADAAANAEATWNDLLQVPTPSLRQYLGSGAIDDTFRAWLELALIAKSTQLSLLDQNRDLQRWQRTWPNHVAAQFLPRELTTIEAIVEERPEAVGLLLPLSGPLGSSGRAIRDGFLAAYYAAAADGEQVPQLRLLDTAGGGEFIELYQQAIAEGCQLIVGPLAKEDLADLAALPTLPVPTLALNYLDAAGEGFLQASLVQFGLSAHDEAYQIARRGRLEGLERALVLAPDSAWGRDVAATLVEAWRQQDGIVLDTVLYDRADDYRRLLADSLQISASRGRAQALQRQLGQVLEFEPRRRQDIELVLMVATPEPARALVPLLAFYYAGDIPVYATSHVYAGNPDPERDADLDGTWFVDLPWLAGSANPLKQKMEQHREYQGGRFQRLYALGVDAYRLLPRLGVWQDNRNGRVFGETGSLVLNAANQVIREGEWLRFRGGRPQRSPPEIELDRDARVEGSTASRQQGGSPWQGNTETAPDSAAD